ncbi:DNA primase [Spiroplasma turonicum]|uniref:DNA primase n=1 Tax=Spiroplasma turonicum TaxID=216946 RepID=A0A0K1P5F1_9MOLU|nr:DNA primase [Spiroplasma turonicum]AKU79526.1 DNA primase [Spiroplasma turonicum]ALX70549.1 DNA primase [Spiroplasma turonicum]
MTIKQEQIDMVLKASNIVDDISDYIDLQKRGRNYVAVCPFHDDSDPSLNVSPDKNIFKCFVCGSGGNVITFIQDFNNLSFFQALLILSKKYKIKIDGLKDFEPKKKFNSVEEKLFQINLKLANLFNGLLVSNYAKEAQSYLEKRKITSSEITKFKIGFCPKEVNIYEFLLNEGFDEQIIKKSDVIFQIGVKNISFFENRIVFPIFDENDNVIGFSGRSINDIDKPKYKNSKENEVFKKSNLAYNFNNAKKGIKVKNEVIILEGFMDVISLERIGINNSIAIMGTALSDYHIKLISSTTNNFKLFLDNDNAGINAAYKISQKLLSKKINLSIVNNESLKDPDELVRDNKINYIDKIIKNAKHPIDYFIDIYKKDLNISDSISLRDYVNKILEVLKYENNSLIIENALLKLSDVTKIAKDVLFKELFENKNNNNNIVQNNSYNTAISNNIDDNNADYFINLEETFNNNDLTIDKDISKITGYENNLKYLEISKNHAENKIIWDLLCSDEYLNEIENNINKLHEPETKIIIEYIINNYKNKNYLGNDWEEIAKKIKTKGKKYWEKIYEIHNQCFTLMKSSLTLKGINDCFDVIELYKIQLEIDEYSKTLETSKNLDLQKSCLNIIENLRERRNIIYQKRRK